MLTKIEPDQFHWLVFQSNLSHCYKQVQNDAKVIEHSDLIIAKLGGPKPLTTKEKNILIKTYIRKGFSEERLEHFKKALLSFGVAKLMQPFNQ